MTSLRSMLRISLLALPLALAACGSLPPQSERPYSTALAPAIPTPIARELEAHPGLSHVQPLADGGDALQARLAMARHAQRSLDLQYYIFQPDDSGLRLVSALLAAADRGVRVRLLLDDIHLEGSDALLAAFATHDNIDVRIFNPFASRQPHWPDFIGDFDRVSRRMHNKSMTADSYLTIVGGRNIGDEYFNIERPVNFSDLDLLAYGRVVHEVEQAFDSYWNSAFSYDIETLRKSARIETPDTSSSYPDTPPEPVTLQTLRQRLAQLPADDNAALPSGTGYWARARVIVDAPDKITRPMTDNGQAATQLFALLSQAQHELLLVSPYFVPGELGTQWLSGAARRGVDVRVLTNSFAATDVRVVHAGYVRHRQALAQAGVQLYELKPRSLDAPQEKRSKDKQEKKAGVGSSKASLHAKVYLVDGKQLFIGSLNLDPRSARLNTEMGIVVESEPLYRHMRARLEQDLPTHAWHVLPADTPDGLIWITQENGREIRSESEPGLGPGDRLMQFLLRLLPIDTQL